MSLVTIWISSTDSYSERRWTPHLTIAELRAKLQPITGISAGSQRLALSINPGGTTDRSILLDNDELTLLDYGVQEGATIDVVDTDPHSAALAGQYNDVSQVEKFELPIQEYEKRSDSLLAFKIRNKLGRFNDDQNKQSEEECIPDQEELQAKYPLGSRCQITPTLSHQMKVHYGDIESLLFNQKHPYWIGVELDEPRGKNNGSVDGHPYFECPPNRGIFIQPDRVTLGDYPPLDFLTGINDDDDDDDEI
ncbi:hypothetical protein PSHT_05432 [Puccinia striiformis]|uniref:CAP-Gly domain-containing protein n=1 Tax=Puccinia striiformis TaxID=27350 RepID=A0A2S4WAP6_9BASI|nr:hypothetical protein PSHT_05432 [Puccinia striiformis]